VDRCAGPVALQHVGSSTKGAADPNSALAHAVAAAERRWAPTCFLFFTH
jgi:hypothetical protein